MLTLILITILISFRNSKKYLLWCLLTFKLQALIISLLLMQLLLTSFILKIIGVERGRSSVYCITDTDCSLKQCVGVAIAVSEGVCVSVRVCVCLTLCLCMCVNTCMYSLALIGTAPQARRVYTDSGRDGVHCTFLKTYWQNWHLNWAAQAMWPAGLNARSVSSDMRGSREDNKKKKNSWVTVCRLCRPLLTGWRPANRAGHRQKTCQYLGLHCRHTPRVYHNV